MTIATWFLITFVAQAGNPQLIQVKPPEIKQNMDVCVQEAAAINADDNVPYLAACLPSYKKVNYEPTGTVS